MANKREVKKIAPSLCIQSLESYLNAVFGLTNILPSLIEYLESGKENPELRGYLTTLIKNHKENIDSHLNYE